MAANECKNLLPNNISFTIFNAKNIANAYILGLTFKPDDTYKENISEMETLVNIGKVCRISTSVKDVKYSHITIKKNDYIGIVDKKIVSNGKTPIEALTGVIPLLEIPKKILKKTSPYTHAYIFYGANISETEVQAACEKIKEKFSVDFETIQSAEKNYFLTICLI
jgi:dihydroxyacetone kinase-like predicted kinase